MGGDVGAGGGEMWVGELPSLSGGFRGTDAPARTYSRRMSINLSYRRVSQGELDGLLAGSAELREKWFGATSIQTGEYDVFAASLAALEGSGRYLDITNSWQSIHFLLTGEFCF